MDTKTQDSEYVEIHPKISYLSAQELIAHRHTEFEPPSGGLKRTKNEGTAAEVEELKRAQEYLRAQLSVPRIERLGGRALAVWHEEQQVAEVKRKDGKFENFGYSEQGKLYLEYFEAMFLLEVGRLQLEYCGLVVSIEQAYVLLLGEMESERYTNYLVYSALSRSGYIVVKHVPPQEILQEVTSADCIWALLKEKVGNQPVPDHIKTSPFYPIAEKRMEDVKELITSQKAEDLNIVVDPIDLKFAQRKRMAVEKPIEEPASKKEKFSTTGRSLVDQLKCEFSYAKFEEIFEKFDMVQLKSQDYIKDKLDTPSALKIIFDLHLHNKGFKKSAPNAPNFNVIILPSQVPFPAHDQISKMKHQNLLTAPLLVISVSESKQIQAFLYYIS
ncbi:uncharacterized protein LOC6737793 isoform X1 [Drosophila simulans]|uniref:GD12738 n=1 Tax=Drosophila simulans TaxID=7240 RepID=B4QR76_DROSI|nr:uncharacterized protein LOC6737793 isoform X1 [Drosophila simulans]XP_016031571.1 uncharacterized protein LOC6737793 isoform X1 [Drosophila simulans]EDX10206.1 GD12738 [Drosophila simulans]KMY99190.1 uncharacterized protein Dsimw501_GD12738, isoform A [Drosophila simulans]KMY99191.1 uncharacterized protein Dsimw501_GD12738, isoform B [Drosophila simulans]